MYDFALFWVQIFLLNTRLAEAESMTHDIVRELLGVKLDISNYAVSSLCMSPDQSSSVLYMHFNRWIVVLIVRHLLLADDAMFGTF
jgi:hypothetical protein